MSKQQNKKKSDSYFIRICESNWGWISCVVFSLVITGLLMGWLQYDYKQRTAKYIEAVKENTVQLNLVGMQYSSGDSITVKHDMAAAGAMIGYVTTGNAGGALLGGSLGSGATYEETKKGEDILIIIAESKGDTFNIEITTEYFGHKLFVKSDVPSPSQLFSFIRESGVQQFYVVTDKPLTKFSKIYSGFIYFDRNKIPQID